MRRFTEFHLCTTRAKLAPVSAHLSICRNFATSQPVSPTQGRNCSAVPRPAPHIGLYACTGAAPRETGSASTRGKPPAKPARAARSAGARPVRARIVQCRIVSGPENAHLRHSLLIRPDADEGPTHAGLAANSSRKRSPFGENAAQQRARKWLPKNLTVTGAVSKIPIGSDTYAWKAFGCAAQGSPEKSHLSTEILHTTTVCRPPKNLTCAKRWHSKNGISSSPGGLFGEFGRSRLPKSLTFDHFFSKSGS